MRRRRRRVWGGTGLEICVHTLLNDLLSCILHGRSTMRDPPRSRIAVYAASYAPPLPMLPGATVPYSGLSTETLLSINAYFKPNACVQTPCAMSRPSHPLSRILNLSEGRSFENKGGETKGVLKIEMRWLSKKLTAETEQKAERERKKKRRGRERERERVLENKAIPLSPRRGHMLPAGQLPVSLWGLGVSFLLVATCQSIDTWESAGGEWLVGRGGGTSVSEVQSVDEKSKSEVAKLWSLPHTMLTVQN
ncbi:unnamed protein product [Pleuronectes platessa]|uniref:Uncharacterized protein n=1 Tax=Pleuronectes platessa TaxID=8262 RepID=A0A9N7YV59_PLEPL|nr:unnamed protein product [Pleuronectes platessa]